MKRLFCFLMILVWLPGLAGCAGIAPSVSVTETESVTLEWYINFSWYNTPWGENAVSKAVTEAAGSEIHFVTPGGTESVTLDALIAGDKLPDMITLGWWEPQFQEMIDSGLVYALNELADEYDPYFWEVADMDRLQWYTQEDGNVYCYPNSSYSPRDYEEEGVVCSNQTFLVRKDIYEAIGSPDMTTTEGFAAAVRTAAEKFPMVDGKPLIPIGAHEFTERGCDSFDKFLLNFLAVPYEKNGLAYDRYTDPEYRRWLSMFRQLGEEGYLASDIFIDKRAQMEEKIIDGRYFCMLYQRTDLAEQQLYRYSQDPDSVYIAVDGPRNAAGDNYILPGSGINGWTVTLISKNCAHPDKAIKMMSFLMSEEGQKLLLLGVEGVHYRMEDGGVVLTEETRALKESDYAEYVRQVGGDDTYWMLQDNRMQAKWQPELEPVLKQMQDWARRYTVFTGQYDVAYSPGSVEDGIDRSISILHGKMLPQLLLAPTQEEFDRLWEDYVRLREEYGVETLLKEQTRQTEAAKKKLHLE